VADGRAFSGYALSHHLPAVLIATVGLSGGAAAWGSMTISLPSGNEAGVGSVPLWVYLPIPIAAMVSGSIRSSMDQFEETAAGILARVKVVHAICGLVISVAILGGCMAASGPAGIAAAAVRNLIFWTGLALVSGRVFGWSLSWVLPTFAAFPFDWFGLEVAGPQSWAWPMQPASDSASWLATIVVLVTGVAFLIATPWRIKSLLRAAAWWS
jgi:hypothetical protein